MSLMFTVADVYDDVKRVLGGCSDVELYSRLNHAVEILAVEADWDPLLGFMDICVGCDGCVALPREVGTVLAVNVCGKPTLGHDKLFQFHLNGAGSADYTVAWHWYDNFSTPVFKYPHIAGSKLVTQLERASDSGKSFRVYGYAAGGGWIRTLESGVWVDGFLVPMQYGTSVANPNAPLITRIERIEKQETDGYVRLYAQDSTGADKYRIGNYAPDETNPEYRLIKVTPTCTTCTSVRVAFKKNVLELSALTDLIPLHSKYALVLMVKALRKFDEDRLEEGQAYRLMAINLLTKKQLSVAPPTAPSFQVADGNLLSDKADRLD
jgi:hypothetical protein